MVLSSKPTDYMTR